MYQHRVIVNLISKSLVTSVLELSILVNHSYQFVILVSDNELVIC